MSHLRVISGTAKGRKLRMVPGEGTRPVTDRVKQALFNIIGPDGEGSGFPDLSAGRGRGGNERLRRGAKRVVFVDGGALACKTIRQNLQHTGLQDGASVLRLDVLTALKKEGLGGPPGGQLARQVDWLNPDCWVIAQMHPKEFTTLPLQRLALFDQRKYG